MKKEMIIFGLIVFSLCSFLLFNTTKRDLQSEKIEAVIMYKDNDKMVIEDDRHVLYLVDNINEKLGTRILLEYANISNNVIDKVISYEVINEINNVIPKNLQDNGIFSDYYTMAYNKLNTMSINEKISQLLLVNYKENMDNIVNKYPFGGVIFDKDFFNDKKRDEVIKVTSNLQSKVKIPLLIGVNEEGGEEVSVSSNNELTNETFLSPSELYKKGGFPLIKEDTIKKSDMLYKLGINLNLAPVLDIADKDTYIYDRTLKEDVNKTMEYAKTIVEASRNTGVSYSLKHFPGYSNNISNEWISIDNRSIEEIKEDIKPFNEGIKSGAEAILISHSIIKSIDSSNPASLSLNIHNMLRDDLKFTGVIISDNLETGSLDNISSKYLKAIMSGNDLIITDNFNDAINEIGNALINNNISETLINYHAFRVIAFKLYKGMMLDEK